MAKEFAKKFYKSKAWQDCREGYIKSVHGLCEKCLEKNKHIPGYIVHHKITLTPNNINIAEITLNWDLLEYQCLDCHNKEHGVGKQNDEVLRDGLMFNSEGQIVKIDG
jgi:5-methylcytosine-specific restriction protein A